MACRCQGNSLEVTDQPPSFIPVSLGSRAVQSRPWRATVPPREIVQHALGRPVVLCAPRPRTQDREERAVRAVGALKDVRDGRAVDVPANVPQARGARPQVGKERARKGHAVLAALDEAHRGRWRARPGAREDGELREARREREERADVLEELLERVRGDTVELEACKCAPDGVHAVATSGEEKSGSVQMRDGSQGGSAAGSA
ncbi:hypothetical protein FB451DRAFT_1174415 [Mycena latifolia]|nr:hypothetical protein FB451DRAFT_1174415 [Mycena latifolia]